MYSDSKNSTLRVKLGYIEESGVYGLDVYEGALRVYTKDDEENPAMWVSNGNIILKGKITNAWSDDGDPWTWMTMGMDAGDERGSGFRIYNTRVYNSDIPIFKIWPGYVVDNTYDAMMICGYNKIRLSPYVTPNNSNGSYSSCLEVNTSGGALYGIWDINTINVGNGKQMPVFRVDVTDVAYLSWISSTYLGLTIDFGTGFAILHNNGDGTLSYKFATNSKGGHLYGTWTPSNWSSDARLKHSIENLNDYYEILFNNL